MREESLRTIHRLQSSSNRGLWYLCLFFAVSLAARWDFHFLPSFSAGFRDFLGRAPPSNLISVALVVYSFSALVLALSRMMGGTESRDALHHIGYLTGFYAFYHFAGTLSDNFWAVFVAGVTVLGLEAYGTWARNAELINEELERLSRVEKRLAESNDRGRS